jgi:hypothetical protein
MSAQNKISTKFAMFMLQPRRTASCWLTATTQGHLMLTSAD